MRVRWGPNGCTHPKFARDGIIAQRGTCTHLTLEIQNPTNKGWAVGKMWSVFIHTAFKGPGTLIQITEIMLQTPKALGPNLILNPQTSRPSVDNTKDSAEEVAPNNTETLNTLEIKMPPLWNLLNSTYQLLNYLP